jgi:hypothetical protein
MIHVAQRRIYIYANFHKDFFRHSVDINVITSDDMIFAKFHKGLFWAFSYY